MWSLDGAYYPAIIESIADGECTVMYKEYDEKGMPPPQPTANNKPRFATPTPTPTLYPRAIVVWGALHFTALRRKICFMRGALSIPWGE